MRSVRVGRQVGNTRLRIFYAQAASEFRAIKQSVGWYRTG